MLNIVRNTRITWCSLRLCPVLESTQITCYLNTYLLGEGVRECWN